MTYRTKRKKQNAASVVPCDNEGELRIYNTKRRITICVHGFNGKDPSVAYVNLDEEAVQAVITRFNNLVKHKKAWKKSETQLPKQKIGLSLPTRIKLPARLIALRQPMKRERVFAIGSRKPTR